MGLGWRTTWPEEGFIGMQHPRMEQGGKDQLWKCDKCEKQFTTPELASYIITITLSPASPQPKIQ